MATLRNPLTLIALLVVSSSAPTFAQGVVLQEGTATLSQSFMGVTNSPDLVHDGNFGSSNGWAILNRSSLQTLPETAAWETACDHLPGTLTFTMHFLHSNPQHLLGRFRLSVTTDDRSTFRDGLDNGGDVSANWVVLLSPTVNVPSGMTSTVQGDGSILMGGSVPATGVYTISFAQPLVDVTGIRLEALVPGSAEHLQPDHVSLGCDRVLRGAVGNRRNPIDGVSALGTLWALAVNQGAAPRPSARNPV